MSPNPGDEGPEGGHGGEIEDHYPHGLKLLSISIGLFLAVLCMGLDRSIIATAIPRITTDFNSLPDVGWYGSAYLLTSCCFQLMFGKLYAEFSPKWVFLAAIAIFEAGSILCATAPNSPVLIVGRAVAGLGAAGVATGALTILAASTPLHDRPKYTGAIGAAMGVSQIVGPTIGGALTDKATWRWCFWLNLPIGGVTIVTILLLLNLPAKPKPATSPGFWQVLQRFDLLGTLFLLPAIICLLLSLQWGGSQYPWSNWRIILMLSIFGVCIVIWFFIQFREGDMATLPLRILTQRSMACAMWYMLCVMGMLFNFVYFLPLWFQAVLNVSAYQSGINMLANTVPVAVLAIASGFITSKIGYYVPLMIVCTVICSVAAGLISRFYLDTSTGYWIGSLILLGLGLGSGGQQALMIPQTVLSGSDIALGTSSMIFMQTLSATVFLSVGQNVFQSRLVSELHKRVPDVDPTVVIASGASELQDSMSKIYPPGDVQGILASYAVGLQGTFLVSVILACLSVFGVVFCEWKSVKKDKNKQAGQIKGEAIELRRSSEEDFAASIRERGEVA